MGKVFTTGAYTVGTAGTSTFTISAEVNGETVEFKLDNAAASSQADVMTALGNAKGTLADGTEVKLSDYLQ